MGSRKRESLTKQVSDRLGGMTAFGNSKHMDKISGETGDKIYSYSTLHTYIKHCKYFTSWCKEEYGCRTLEQCRPHAAEWIEQRIEEGKSSYTIKLEAAALGKLYGVPFRDLGIKTTPERKRADITRSRTEAKRDKHFSEERNSDLVDFCRSTGLRRREVAAVRGCDLRMINGEYYIHVRNGKGGKERDVLILDSSVVDFVQDRRKEAPGRPLFAYVSSNADIHGYRAEYAQRLYNRIARPIEEISVAERYYCRGDKKGIVYDRDAMLAVSRMLGHNRINVIAEHYL